MQRAVQLIPNCGDGPVDAAADVQLLAPRISTVGLSHVAADLLHGRRDGS
jgi:hypothetical protein